jgi:hypothetical protein
MPWTKADVESHNKGLSDHEQATWVEVANKALATCQADGGDDCDAHAIRQANAAVRNVKAEANIVLSVRSIPDGAVLETVIIDEAKGVSALMAGKTMIEYYFPTGGPNRWTEQHARAWMSHRFINAAAVGGILKLPDEQLPAEVIEARNKLKEIDGSEPFIRRLALKAGRFVIGQNKPIHFTQRFYNTFVPMYANKPVYRGHDGSSDDRERIGVILAYQNVGGDPYFWLYINNREVIRNILETEALGITAEEDVPYGQFSIEAEMIRGQKDAEGYQEPMELSPNNLAIALVNRAGATGRIERIAANTPNLEDSTMEDKEKKEVVAALGMDEIRGHAKFEEAFAARLAEYVWLPLDEKNPLTAMLPAFIEGRTPEVTAIADKINAGAIKLLSGSDMRYKIMGGATKDEMPWLPAHNETVAALSADQVKAIPAFSDAVNAMKAEELAKLPSVAEVLAAKDREFTSGSRLLSKLVGEGVIAAGAVGSPAGTIFGAAPAGADPATAEKTAILAKAKENGFKSLSDEEIKKGGDELIEAVAARKITL